jgi:YfiH family protein
MFSGGVSPVWTNAMSTWLVGPETNDAYVYCRALAEAGGIAHGVTTRRGDLRLSASTEPDTERLRANRILACSLFQSSLTDCTIPRQTHGNRVGVVREDNRGAGGWPPDSGPADTDALVTDAPGILLGITIADCLPVFLYDPVHRAIGLAHSGWRGTAGRIVSNTLAAMNREYGSNPRDIIAAIGPGIGGCCYEVGDEVKAGLQASGAADTPFEVSPNDRWMLDLKQIAAAQLREGGVPDNSIQVAPWCTVCHNHLFFSHRKEGPTAGRMGAFLKLAADPH